MTLQSNRLLRIIVSLAMIFCLLLCLSVPSHAVAGVDDAIVAGLIACLGSMGMDFFAQGLDRSGVVDEVVKWAEDNIGQLPERVQLALVAPNVLSVGGVLWNYAVECAEWFKSKFPSGSGTDNIVSAGSSVELTSPSGFSLSIAPWNASLSPGNASSFSPSYFPLDDSNSYSFKLGSTFKLSFWYSGRSTYYSVGVVPVGGSTLSSTVSSMPSLSSLVSCYLLADSSYLYLCWLTTEGIRSYARFSCDFDQTFPSSVSGDGSFDLIGADVASPETVPENKNMFLGLPSSFSSLPEFVDRVFDGVDSDSAAGPLQSDYSSELSDLIDVNGNILSNTNTIASGVTGILSGVHALVADLVGFIGELPGYIGSLSGKFLSIWHYVVDWVNSLRPFLNSMFSVWQGLPVAMVLPVYATAVIVIVLGLYKRFFM